MGLWSPAAFGLRSGTFTDINFNDFDFEYLFLSKNEFAFTVGLFAGILQFYFALGQKIISHFMGSFTTIMINIFVFGPIRQ